jgi:hypothetical protein
VDRWLGKTPAALGEVMDGDALEIAGSVMRTVALRAAAPDEAVPPSEPFAVVALPPVSREDDPMPPGFEVGPGAPVPIGWIDTGTDPATGGVWVGGDVLVPAHVRAEIAGGRTDLRDVPVEGASLADLEEAVHRARGSCVVRGRER